jgi:hypothetical protein
MDGSSLGHPGKYTMLLAEDEPPAPWEPLRIELGYEIDDTTVTVLGAEGVRQIANHLNGTPEGLLRSFAATMRCPTGFFVGKGGQGVLVIGPEHRQPFLDAGWSKLALRRRLVEETRVTPAELDAAGILVEEGTQHDMTPGPDGRLPTFIDADDILVVTSGGAGAGWSAYIPVWAPKLHSVACTRAVPKPGTGLPVR